ncbi:uncharacterized protein LOC114973009 [Acropora millepora]|uniref:uncharacterized protein LOC114973009 n=1 Tax=Acropora millepora TaxID=45264 RepID=UPI001CF235DA|nr:uncharacterized protein LOC114973009 [Acropora millepora]
MGYSRENMMAAAQGKNSRNILNIVLFDDQDDSESSSAESSDDDLDLLLLDAVCCFAEPQRLGPRLNLEDVGEIECEQMFRFHKQDIPHLFEALGISQFYTTPQGSMYSGMEALLILLRRLSYPNRWCDLVPIMGRSEPELSMVFNMIIDDLYTRFNHLLDSLDLVWLEPSLFADAIQRKGAPLDQCWGFIDGTARPIAN